MFTNDGMPNTICDPCRLIMDYCYRFKQMCKKADTALKQFPLTGSWPAKYDLPVYPEDLLPTVTYLRIAHKVTEQNNRRKLNNEHYLQILTDQIDRGAENIASNS